MPDSVSNYKASNLIARAKIMANIRQWFEKNQFIEVETPILVDCPDLSPNFDILTTKIHKSGESPLERGKGCVKYLITSPEFSMKKLLSLDGMDNIYTITKVFRDGEEDTGIHSIEFKMLEWYRKNADYNDIMRDTEELVKQALPPFAKGGRGLSKKRHSEPALAGEESPGARNGCCNAHFATGSFAPQSGTQDDAIVFRQPGRGGFFDGTTYSYSPDYLTRSSFPRLKISNLFKKYAQIDNVEKLSLPLFTKIVHTREYSKDKNLTCEQCFNLIFLNEIEPKLPKTPFFLIDYPKPLAAMAKLKNGNPHIAERFELYINGIELWNGFSELTDGKEQLARFKQENRERKQMGKPEFPIDYELCEKLDLIGKTGLPRRSSAKAGGNALGIDRLVMLILGAEKIEDVMY